MDVFKKRKRSQSQRTHVKICNVCGSKGFSNALVYCSQCSDTMVHKYCVGIPPGNLDVSSNWVCEYCHAVMEPESCTCHVSASASSERNPECCIVHAEALAKKSKSEILVILDQPGPLCFLYPVACKENSEHEDTRSGSQFAEEVLNTASISLDCREENETSVSSFMEYPETLIYGMVLVASPSGKITIPRSSDLYDEINSQNVGDSAICRLTYGEELEAQFSSFMEYPEEISGELVLLVKPAGEIFIEYGSSFHNDSHLHNMVRKGNLWYEETRSYYQIDEEVPNTAPISIDFSLYNWKEYERPDFMENPESLMYGLVLVASPSGQFIIYRSSDMCSKFNSQKAEDRSTSRFLTYGDELEAQASSFMEYPKEISRDLLLLVKPTGEIIWREIKSDSFVGTLVPHSVTPGSFPFDEVSDRCVDFGYDCCMEDIDPICVPCMETDVWSSDTSDGYSKTDMQGDVVFESMFDASDNMEGISQQSDQDLEADGSKSKHGMDDKKTRSSSSIIYGYIPPIRPECKRPRSKRYKTSSLPTKEIDDICRVADLPGTVSGFKQGTKRKKTLVIRSLALCGRVPPLQPGCRRVRSERWKVRSAQLRQKFYTPL